MRSVTDEGVIIGLMDYRDNDRIVTLFTREHGRVGGVARGARRSVRRFGGSLELFTRLSLSFTPAEGLVTIQDVDPVTIYPGIRSTIEGIAHAGYACELVAAMLPERLANQRVFRLLCAYLDRLDGYPAARSDRHFFEINLLNILGYRPPIDNCSVCGDSLASDGGTWSGDPEGGISCSRCSRGGTGMGGGAVTSLLMSLSTGRFGQVIFPPRELDEVGAYLDAFINSHLQRPLKSLAFLRLSP